MEKNEVMETEVMVMDNEENEEIVEVKKGGLKKVVVGLTVAGVAAGTGFVVKERKVIKEKLDKRKDAKEIKRLKKRGILPENFELVEEEVVVEEKKSKK